MFLLLLNPDTIKKFLLQVRDHPERQGLIQEHSSEAGVPTLLQTFIENCLSYDPDHWGPYSIQFTAPETLIVYRKRWWLS